MHTYVIDGAIVAAQQEEGSRSVTAGYGNNVLNLKKVNHLAEHSAMTETQYVKKQTNSIMFHWLCIRAATVPASAV